MRLLRSWSQVVTLALMYAPVHAQPMKRIEEQNFGSLPDGTPAKQFTLRNARGIVVDTEANTAIDLLWRDPHRTPGAGPARRPDERGAGCEHPGRVSQRRSRGGDHRARGQSHRRSALYTRWCRIQTRREQRPQSPPWRAGRLRQRPLAGQGFAGRSPRVRRSVHLPQQGRRRRLSRQSQRLGDLHAHRRQRTAN